jgi:EAL domain-containing protein (putative c-di-GMP-specific phosphodiesterase class I)
MNLSGKVLGDEELLYFLKSRISLTGADPDRLVFEITETAAVHDLGRAIGFIKDLKSLGCCFALDDFGVGFTSFVYLKEMNVDYIKIDGSFIKRLLGDRNDRLFVKAMTDVAKGMGIKTVAEMAECEETLRLLKELGVDYAQGYLISKPMPLKEFLRPIEWQGAPQP